MQYYDKLNSLNDESVWLITKQSSDFDEAFKATKLFNDIINKDDKNNLEKYFLENYSKYDMSTNRHRILIISQLFGLISKTQFYKKTQYSMEHTTNVFKLLNKYKIGSIEYNIIKTEQILKLKIKAITNIENQNNNYNILPVTFSYKVLKTLKDKYSISNIDKKKFITYVMTCSKYEEIEEAAFYLQDKNSTPYKNINLYIDKSRLLPIIKNINLFIIDENTVSINNEFDDYFYKNFIEIIDIDELNSQLIKDIDYEYFLTNPQNFNINLIDKPNEVLNYDIKVATNAYNVIPNIINTKLKKYHKNPIIGKIAIQQYNYLCIYNNEHTTFISQITNKPFMEAHHLIPISYQQEMWERFHINIDCIENIVSLCPNCHRAIHYGKNEEKIKIITKLYDIKKQDFIKIGLNIELDELVHFYID